MTKMALMIQVNEDRSQELGSNITRILDDFFSGGYDRRVRPNYGGPAVEVGVTMFIIGISTVSEVQMDFTSDFYFRQTWKDTRLAFKPLPTITELYVGAEVADRIWVPDTFFANEKSAYFHIATTKNTFLRIGANGDVLRSIRLTVTASCPMNLQYFPLDRQLCKIEIESYGYSMADIKYVWAKGLDSVSIDDKLELPQFKVVGHKQSEKVITLSTGNYSRLICDIQFARSMGYYLIQIYIPASLIVIISWVSFWLHRNATPARVALGVTTVLTMTTLMSSTNSQLPKISYIKSIDVFLGTCFVMVFASLLEYATVGYLGKRIAMQKSRLDQLTKLAEEHRRKCAAAAAAAATAAQQLTSGANLVNSQPTAMLANQQQQANQAQYICVNTGPHFDSNMAPTCRVITPGHHLQRTRSFSGHHGGQTAKVIYGCPQTPSGNPGATFRPMDTNGQPGANPVKLNGPPVPFGPRDPDKMLGVSPSDIDKYSRVVFPVCFICFNLMYWIIYIHISDELVDGLVPLGS
ncbi:Gamma-aminobutyric acid receptor subunit beta [Halotydeus destructor]|nr:Gamma-aminobutyric acid receptor subunit beta [Halotydeus destructor]